MLTNLFGRAHSSLHEASYNFIIHRGAKWDLGNEIDILLMDSGGGHINHSINC